MTTSIPLKVQLHKASQEIELNYADAHHRLSAEFLRTHSPSAEVSGHGKLTPPHGKSQVKIVGIETVGRYAIKIFFDDGHDSGIYSWNYLSQLCQNFESLWSQYLAYLHTNSLSRDPCTQVLQIISSGSSLAKK